MGEMDAVGDVVAGGMLARAVEPKAGEAADGHTHEGNCLNCGAELTGPYCRCCGQQAHVHRTLGAFFHDLLHGVFHFEGKIWRTLPMLAWRPGELTRRYISGERARFVSPVALFLFTVFLMFAVYSFAGPNMKPDGLDDPRGDVAGALQEQRRELTTLQESRTRAQRGSNPQSIAKIDEQIRETQEGIKALEKFEALEQGNTSQIVNGKTGWKALDEKLKKFNANPQLAFYKIQSNAYKFSWALIPISVPFVWLLFLHRRRYRQYGAYDHTVFVTYSITFVSIWLVVLALTTLIPGLGWFRKLMLFIPPIHMYRQLRGAYELGRFSAIWRTAVLSFFALVAIVLFLLLLVALGIMA